MKSLREALRRMQHRLAQDESGFTLAELLVVIVISGVVVGAIGSSFVVSTQAATASQQRLDRSRDAQQTSTYFMSDGQNASYFSASTVPTPAMASCADFGSGNVAVFEWIEAGVRKDAIYGTTKSPSQLVRRYCEAGVARYDVTLVRNVGTTAPVVTCPTTPCDANSPYLELEVHASSTTYESSVYQYTVRVDPRTAPSGNPMSGIAIYVGSGGLTGGGSKTEVSATGGSVTIGGSATCNGESKPGDQMVVAPDGFYSTGGGTCNGVAGGSLPADPYLSLPPPPEPANSVTVPDKKNGYQPPNSTACGPSMPTFQPGRYPQDDALEGGSSGACLASGIYYFEAGATLSDLVSAPGGVHIYIESGGADLSDVTLSPLTSSAQGSVTIFTARSAAPCAASGTCQSIETNDGVTVNGVIYAPAGELQVRSDSGALEAGAINVAKLTFAGNSDGLITLGV